MADRCVGYQHNVVLYSELSGRFFFARRASVMQTSDGRHFLRVSGRKIDVTGSMQAYVKARYRARRAQPAEGERRDASC